MMFSPNLSCLFCKQFCKCINRLAHNNHEDI
jgi:hypothetical protein